MNKSIPIFVAIYLMLIGSTACAATYSSKALIGNAKVLDGKKVVYRGEAVTAIMKRGEYAWVNVNDGGSAIGVWCKGYMLAPVQYLGGYKTRGDMLEINGVFNMACPEHGGELDIHANSVKIIQCGSSVPEHPSRRRLAAAVVLLLSTIAVTAVFRRRI